MAEANPSPGFARDPDRILNYEPTPGRVVVTRNGVALATSEHALVCKEADYPPVFYLPRADVAMEHMVATDRTSHCPYKGDASYWSITVGGALAENAAWSYETPFDEAEAIREYVAFYADKVEISASG